MNLSSINNFKRLNLKKNYLIVCNDNGTIEVFSGSEKRILQTGYKVSLNRHGGTSRVVQAKTAHSVKGAQV